MSTTLKFPFYIKGPLLLIGLYVLVSMLSIAQTILLPVIYATILAILISPAVNFLVRKKMNRTLAIALVLFISVLLVVSLIGFLLSQFTLLRDALPQLTNKFEQLLNQFSTWASGYLNISTRKFSAWFTNMRSELLNNSTSGIGSTISSMGGFIAAALLTPTYIFMLLYYKPHLIKFAHRLFGSGNNEQVTEILTETKVIVQSYLVGLFIEFVIIAVLNATGLLLLGMDYAILLAIIGALLNVIPYVGAMMAVLIYMTVALVTKTPVYVFYLAGLYFFIQIIDNNFIVPKIVGSKVKLNAFASLLAVICGAALWGIPGMFLSIPLLAIIKLLLDRAKGLEPWGFLLGDTMPSLIKLKTTKKQ